MLQTAPRQAARPAVIDEETQSRQLALYGHAAMQTLREKTVLITRLNGLAVEIAKNVVLANVGALLLCVCCCVVLMCVLRRSPPDQSEALVQPRETGGRAPPPTLQPAASDSRAIAQANARRARADELRSARQKRSRSVESAGGVSLHESSAGSSVRSLEPVSSRFNSKI